MGPMKDEGKGWGINGNSNEYLPAKGYGDTMTLCKEFGPRVRWPSVQGYESQSAGLPALADIAHGW